MELAQEEIIMCKADSAQMNQESRLELFNDLPHWQELQENNIIKLKRTFIFKNFKAALTFTNLISELAETANHHPTITLEWGKVTVLWWTHTILGLHRNDFIMAARLNTLFNQQQS